MPSEFKTRLEVYKKGLEAANGPLAKLATCEGYLKTLVNDFDCLIEGKNQVTIKEVEKSL